VSKRKVHDPTRLRVNAHVVLSEVRVAAPLYELEVILGIGARFVAIESSELVTSTAGHHTA